MHGELPKRLLTQGARRGRRYAVGALIAVALAAALYYVFGAPVPQHKQFRKFAA